MVDALIALVALVGPIIGVAVAVRVFYEVSS